MLVWLKFIVCVAVIFFFGRKIARYGDIIAEKTGLGGVWIGVILISLVTSLPEVFTGISAITLVGAPDLTIGNIFGANTYNLLNLALLDFAHKQGSLLSTAKPGHRLTALFSLALVIVAGLGIFLSHQFSIPGIGWIGWYTPVIIILYLLSMRRIFHFEKRVLAEQEAMVSTKYTDIPLSRVYVYFAVAAAFIIGSGVWLAMIGDEIASVTGWGQSFVGSLFIGFTTTLPEITVSFTAMRMGAHDLAIANMIGSNLFNMLIICIDDLLYVPGSVLGAVSMNHLITMLTVMAMTLVFIAGLKIKPKRYLRFDWLNCSMVVLFLAGSYFSFAFAS